MEEQRKIRYQQEVNTEKTWRLVQVLTSLEDNFPAKSISSSKESTRLRSEVSYKNLYITNPLIVLPRSKLSTMQLGEVVDVEPSYAKTKRGKLIEVSSEGEVMLGLKTKLVKELRGQRFPINANFVAQWLSENIVSSKTYKLSLLCDRVIKVVNSSTSTSPTGREKTQAVVAQTETPSKGELTTERDTGFSLLGIKIIISGRILGAEIATSKTFKSGQLPSNTIKVNKQSGFALAKTRSGTIGIKVSLFWKKS